MCLLYWDEHGDDDKKKVGLVSQLSSTLHFNRVIHFRIVRSKCLVKSNMLCCTAGKFYICETLKNYHLHLQWNFFL